MEGQIREEESKLNVLSSLKSSVGAKTSRVKWVGIQKKIGNQKLGLSIEEERNVWKENRQVKVKYHPSEDNL